MSVLLKKIEEACLFQHVLSSPSGVGAFYKGIRKCIAYMYMQITRKCIIHVKLMYLHN